ncbi:hypothetical protein HDU76_005504 [Blyttiomyces sp. JEL0837]|nr:hypothetical protein HDU76_005504 [Blyttiomyces sp. JEL0837]
MAANQNTPPGLIHEDVVEPHETHSSNTPSRVIAIAVDASKFSEYAFSWYVCFKLVHYIVVFQCLYIIWLVAVRPAVNLTVYSEALYVDFSKEFEAIEAANKKQSHDLLRAFAGKLPAHKYNIRGVALRGDPPDEIAYKAADIKADMLIIGSRGLGAFKRTLLGSVSDYLVHHVKCPVIVARMSEEEAVK